MTKKKEKSADLKQSALTPRFLVKPRKPGKTFNHRLEMYGENRTKQAHKDDCDINLIMARFIKTGVMDHVRDHGPQYGFASSDDFRESMEIVAKANSMFEDLPSQIRNQFNNDAGAFLDFVQNPENIDEMREMGLANPTPSEIAKPKTATVDLGLSEAKDTPQEKSDAQASGEE